MKLGRPMLAAKCDDDRLIRYPCIVSEKYDGIRCRVFGGEVLSRSNKLIQNAYVRETISEALSKLPWLEGCDGELMLADPKATFQDVSSAIMSHDGEPDFVFYVFDGVPSGDMTLGYRRRLERLQACFKVAKASKKLPSWLRLVPTEYVGDRARLLEIEKGFLAKGGEGVMIRSPDGPYKQGRSTMREGYLVKLKRFEDFEAVVVGFEEQQENLNAASTNELGLTKRSSAKAGKRGKNTLGAFIVVPLERASYNGGSDWTYSEDDTFKVGGGLGLTNDLRKTIWENQSDYQGKILRGYYQKQGTKDAPRIPQWSGFRDADDL